MADVFISYASEDRDRIAPLVEALEAEGWSVWWDQHIYAGPQFRSAITEAIEGCRCMVVAWSKASVASDFVIDEATEGKDRNILVPFQLDDTEIPLGFRAAQTARLRDWPNTPGEVDRLLAGIRATIEGRSTAERVYATPDKGLRQRSWAIGSAAIAAVVAALMFALWSPSPPVENTSIAVLPLKNTSGKPDESYLVEGLHEALIANLSKITSLKVTSPTSTRLVDRKLALPEIARILGVANIIEGSVLHEGNRVRVIVQLIDAAADESRWSETYDRELINVLALQTEITRAIAQQIEVHLTPQDEINVQAIEKMNPQTYEAYLKGMYELRKENLRGYRAGIRIMREALEQDPDSALAHAGVAIGYSMLGHNFFPESALPKAREAALKALALDDTLPEVHLAMGMYKMYFEWNWESAEHYLLRALEINPSLVDAHYHYAWLLELLRRHDEALYHGERTKELDPLSPFYNGWLADQYRGIERFDEAIAQAQFTIELSESYPLGWFALGNTYAELGDFDKAIEAHERLRDRYFWSWALGNTYAKAGRFKEARAVAVSIEHKVDNAMPLALISAAIGDEEGMYRWLSAAKDERMSWYPWLLEWFPATASYRDQPRMRALAKELNLPEGTR